MVQLRDIQTEAIAKVLAAVKKGKTDILIQAPTGVGKSLIALELAKHFEEQGLNNFILTSDKLLQQQYEDDCAGKFNERHGNVVSISGIDNYNCHINGKKFSLGHCKTLGLSNRKALANLPCAASCMYLQRWKNAQASPTAVFNYSYYLIQMNYVLNKLGEYAPFQRRNVVICDEAHSLSNIIESHFACFVDNTFVKNIKEVQDQLREDQVYIEFLGVKYGELATAISKLFKLPYKETANHLLGLHDLFNVGVKINTKIADAKTTIRHKYKLKADMDGNAEDFIAAATEANEKLPGSVKKFLSFGDAFKDYMCKLEDYIQIMVEQGVDNMVVEGTPTGRKYHNLCDEKLFDKHFKPFSDIRIFLSATLQPENMIKRMGLQSKTTEVIVLNSGWNPDFSPIILKNTANFKHANKEQAILDSVIEINKILKNHKNERGIIHTTSYDILKHIVENVKDKKRLHTYENTAGKIKLLEDLKNLPKDAVIIGPSLTQGVDLHDDLANFNIIMKLSYPNIGSALWRKRFQKKRFVYWAEAANTLEQSAGRTTRHSEDNSVTYILDARAQKFINAKSTRKFFSEEFLKRISLSA
jgi:ATP-dependent DNA helicase DinG